MLAQKTIWGLPRDAAGVSLRGKSEESNMCNGRRFETPRYKYKTGFCVFQKIIFDKKAFYPISILKYEQIQQMY